MGGLSERCKGETVSIKKSYQKFDSEGKNKTKLRYRVLEGQISPEGFDIIDSPHHSQKTEISRCIVHTSLGSTNR